MDNKKKSFAAFSLLFGAAFAGDASALEPVVNNDPTHLTAGIEVAVQQNNNNNNESLMAAAAKPSMLRQLDADLRIS